MIFHRYKYRQLTRALAVLLLLASPSLPLRGQALWCGSGAGGGTWRARSVPAVATASLSQGRDSSLVVVEHLDGLGRVVQSKSFRAGSPSPAIGGYTHYDARGRVDTEWLAAPVGGGAAFSPLEDVRASQAATTGMYTSVSYDPDPLGRERERLRPGQARHAAGKGVRTEHLYNTGYFRDETHCPRLCVKSGRLTVQGGWKPGELRVTRVTDEDGERLLTFTDPRGRVVMERRVTSGGERSDVRHHYDAHGRLWLSAPPYASRCLDGGVGIRLDHADGRALLYVYGYDSKGRASSVSVPGGGVTVTARTPEGLPALVRDGSLTAGGKAMRSVYDRLGRHLYTGLQPLSATAMDSCLLLDGVPSEARSLGSVPGGVLGYTPAPALSGKTLAATDVLKVDYWDDYAWLTQPDYRAYADSLAYKAVPGMTPRGGERIARGKSTGGARRLIGPDGGGTLLPTACYYDSRGRLVQSVCRNSSGGYSRTSLRLSHDGRVLRRVDSESTPDTLLYTERRYSYTPELRLSRVELRHTPSGPWREINRTCYDPWGRVSSESLLGGGVTTTRAYTPEGDLEHQMSEPWGMSLYRETDPQGAPGYLNGRVKAEEIRLSQTPRAGVSTSGGRYLLGTYTYTYEGDRLTEASYTEQSRQEGVPGYPMTLYVAESPDYSATYEHDADGNLTRIRRHGLMDRTEGSVTGGGVLRPGGTLSPRRSLYGLVDDITLSYEGGRLVRADDSGEDCTLSVATDWSESVQENGEYTYDPDGRMTSDKNKGVTQITYNALGLVETVHTPQGLIRHTYDSEGRLVRRSYGTLEWVTVDMGFTSFTRQEYRESRRVDYLGELMLEDGKVYRRLHEAGWTDGEGREVAAVRDWRGSLRATWTDTGEGGEKVFDNLTGYYPYGLPWADWQGSERWLYGGKELEREHGLWTYDFHAREQDPALGRFRAPDPLADRYKHLNPYLYAAANPITYTDPTGCEIVYDDLTVPKDYKNELKSLYSSAPILSYLYNYINESNEKVLVTCMPVFTTTKDNKKIPIGGRAYRNDENSEFAYTIEMNSDPSVRTSNSNVEEFYHIYQLMFNKQDDGENKEFEGKHFVTISLGDASIGANIDYTIDSGYWLDLYSNGTKFPDYYLTPEFAAKYVKIGRNFPINKDAFKPNSPYLDKITKVPDSLLDIIKNFNKGEEP